MAFCKRTLSSVAAVNKVIVFTESNETFKMGAKKKESLHRMPLQCLTTFHNSANSTIFESSLSKYIVHGLIGWSLEKKKKNLDIANLCCDSTF